MKIRKRLLESYHIHLKCITLPEKGLEACLLITNLSVLKKIVSILKQVHSEQKSRDITTSQQSLRISESWEKVDHYWDRHARVFILGFRSAIARKSNTRSVNK